MLSQSKFDYQSRDEGKTLTYGMANVSIAWNSLDFKIYNEKGAILHKEAIQPFILEWGKFYITDIDGDSV